MLVTLYIVILDWLIRWEIDENDLGRSSLHPSNRNALSFQDWGELN